MATRVLTRSFSTAAGSPPTRGTSSATSCAAAVNPRRDRERLRRSLQHALRRTPEGKWTWKYDRRLLDRGPEDVLPRAMALWDAARAIDRPALVLRGGSSELFLDEDAAKLA